MANDEKKKPLVTLDAGNPAEPDKTMQDYTKPETAPIGSDWAGNQSATVSPSTGTTQNDGTKTLSYDQVKEFEKTGTVSGRDPNNPNVGPGGVNMKMGLLPSGTNFGVLAGAPSQVVIDHMLEAGVQPRTKEEQEKLEKKRKRDALFAAIGDGVSALSNLYFTTKGSPSADQSKSLSKAIRERDDKEDKEYETAMDRRMKLLKEKQADWYRLQQLKIREQLAEAEKAAKEAKTANDRKKAEDMMKYYTERNQILREEKEAEAKREQEEADNRNKNRDSRTVSQNAKEKKIGDAATRNASSNEKKANAYSSSVANQNYNRDRDTTDKINKRGTTGGRGGNSYNNTKKLGL